MVVLAGGKAWSSFCFYVFWGLGFRVQGLGFRVQGLGFRVFFFFLRALGLWGCSFLFFGFLFFTFIFDGFAGLGLWGCRVFGVFGF